MLKKADALICAAVLCAGLIFFAFSRHAKPGDVCEVYVDGARVQTMDLSVPAVYEPRGGVIIEISGGAAFFAASTCPDKVCVRAGRVSNQGQTAVCLPNNVYIAIVSSAPGADAFSR